MFNGLEIDTLDEYPNSIFFVKNGHEVYMEQDYKNERLYCSYDKVWSFFESKIDLNYREISDLIKHMVEKQLKNKVFTPIRFKGSFSVLVEKQLKNKVFTPFGYALQRWVLVEQQLKNKVFTPSVIASLKKEKVGQQLKNKVSVSYGNTEKVEEDNLI